MSIDTQTCLRCKKIGYAIKKGSSIERVREMFKEELPLKVIKKSYDSVPHLSKSRLGESDSTIDWKQESFMTTQFPPVDCILYIEEKMDGSNCAVVRKGKEIIAVGRSGYRCSESNYEHHRRFHRYVEKRKDMFEKLLPEEDDRVVGEWLARAHGVIYNNLESPYQVFDLFRGGKRLNFEDRSAAFSECGLTPVPLIYKGKDPVSIDTALSWAIQKNPITEGVVYRLELFNKKLNKYIPHIIAKVVRMEKEDGKYIKEGCDTIWLWEEKENNDKG